MNALRLLSILFFCLSVFTGKGYCDDSLAGTWTGAITGPGNHIAIRIAGDPGRYTATTDSLDQGLVALPTGVAMDENGNVTIKIAEPSPLIFTGTLKGKTLDGNWAEDTHGGPMTLTQINTPSTSTDTETIPHLAGTWEGVRSGIAFHYVFHIGGIPGHYRSSADSPDQNAEGLSSGAKMDSMNNIFLSIGFTSPLYFTGVYTNGAIPGTWSQGGAIGEMTLQRIKN